MTHLDDLVNWFENKGKVMIALSGGVDSALVAYAAFKKLGPSAIAVTKAVREAYSKTLMVKLSPNVTSIVEFALAVEEAGADSISLINF